MKNLIEAIHPSRNEIYKLLRVFTALIAILILGYVLVPAPTIIHAQSSPALDTSLTVGQWRNNEYGYQISSHRMFGSIGETTFSLGARDFTVEYIKWDANDDEIEFAFRGCLIASEFTSLTIGSTRYTSPDKVGIRDALCLTEPTRLQEFEFHGITSNPFGVPLLSILNLCWGVVQVPLSQL